MDSTQPSSESSNEPVTNTDHTLPIDDTAPLTKEEALEIARVRATFASDFRAATQAPASAKRVKYLALAVLAAVVITVIPLLLAPMFLHPRELSPATAEADLNAFATYMSGRPANSSQVAYVKTHAVKTSVGPGQTLYALASGKLCFGVVIGSPTSAGVVLEPANYCSLGTNTTTK